MIPSDKETLRLLYGKKKEQNSSVPGMRGRNLSPSQKFLLESISSLDKLQDSVYISPTSHNLKAENLISPELNYESHRFMSEGEGSPQEKKIKNIEIMPKPKSALSKFQSHRYFSMPKARNRSKHSISSTRSGIPTYFKDAAKLLKSRLLKQIKKTFDTLHQFSNGNVSL